MNKLWKIATSPTVEDAAKDVFIKNVLTSELASAVKMLQQDSVNKNKNVVSNESANNVCHCIEAIFIHGLKDRLSNKVSLSAVFGSGSEKLPDPDFWPLVMVYSHRDVLKDICKLSNITTDVGHCRAWLRMALNDGLIMSYLDTMLKDKATLQCYYRSGAYLRDDEQPDIMKCYMEGLAGFSFQLPYNCSSLNSWSVVPLRMAGVWNLPSDLEPVMPAVDVAACIDEQEEKSLLKSSKKKVRELQTPSRKQISDAPESASTDDGSNSCVQNMQEDASDEGFTDNLVHDDSVVFVTKVDNSTLEQAHNVVDRLDMLAEAEVIEIGETKQQTAYGTPDPKVLNMLHDQSTLKDEASPGSPNSQLVDSWSSAILDEKELGMRGSIDSQSFNVLLLSYAQNHGRPLVDTHDLLNESDCTEPESPLEESLSKQFSKSDSLDSLEFEVVPKHLAILSPKLDEETKAMIDIIGTIPQEKGLDAQQCKCKGCGRPVGMIYGKSRVCSYDGYNYCYDCHDNEEHVIPARIVHNWDFGKYPVSKHAKSFLTSVEEEPLLNVKATNPQLYSVIQEMAKLQYLRVELNFLKSYLLTCRDSSGEVLRKLIWPREYLYEHVHCYSVADLLQAKNGSLVQLLQKAVAFAKKHVYACELCSQKGYICEVCNNPQVIYPFEVTTTHHCESCSGVYHNKCMADGLPCPKCERRRKREISLQDS